MFMIEPQPNDGFEWTQAPWGPALRCAPLAAIAEHLFTTANLQLIDDEREWTALAARMHVDRGRLRLIQQVHGVDVVLARDGASGDARPRGDIVLSDDPSVAVAVRVADCAPILLGDRHLGTVGAAHAGWRGTVQGAAGKIVEAMTVEFGSRPEDLVAAIGPCLGPCCGEVGPEVLDGFRAAGHAADDLATWLTPGPRDRHFLNLWEANRRQLELAGIPAAQIHVAAICTKTHASRFHSYRAHGRHAGRMAGIIRARGPWRALKACC